MANNREINIINLLHDSLPESMEEFFRSIGANLVAQDSAEDYSKFSYILTQTEEEAAGVSKAYNVIENEIDIICLSHVKETKNFLLANGRLCINPTIIETDLGKYLFRKFFLSEFSLHLDDISGEQFSSFKSFKVTNHLAMGSDLDQLAIDAFESEFNIVAVRTFIEHAVIFLTYLKQAGLSGIPYEVEYTSNDNIFAINIHAPVKNFIAEYLIDSFGEVNSDDPLKYLLGVVKQSSDFLDITFLENPGKLVFTAYWSKEGGMPIEGIAFNNILTSTQAISKIQKKISNHDDDFFEPAELEESATKGQQDNLKLKNLPGGILEMLMGTDENSILNSSPQDTADLVAFTIATFLKQNPGAEVGSISDEKFLTIISDYDNKEFVESLTDLDKDQIKKQIQKNNISKAYTEEIQRVKDSLEDDDDFQKSLSDTQNEKIAQKVSGSLDVEVLNRILGGEKDDEDASILVKGSKDKKDDFLTTIGGMGLDERGVFNCRFGEGFEEQLKGFDFNLKLSGTTEEKKSNIMNFLDLAVKTVDDIEDFDIDVMSFFKEKAPRKLELGLERYAEKMGQTMESLSALQLTEFKDTELPSLLENILTDNSDIDDFVMNLEVESDLVFQEGFKSKLEEKLELAGNIEKEDNKFVITADQVSKDYIQQIIQESVQETLSKQFDPLSNTEDELAAKEKQIIHDLTETLSLEEEEVKTILKEAKNSLKEVETNAIVESIFKNQPGEENITMARGENGKFIQSESTDGDQSLEKSEAHSSSIGEAELLSKIRKSEKENADLKKKIDILSIKLDAANDQDAVLTSLEEDVIQAVNDDIGANQDVHSQVEVATSKAIIVEVESGTLSKNTSKAVKEALEREKRVLEMVKQAEANVKKLEIASRQKDNTFKSEINKANKQLKAKDMIVEKSKDAMKALVSKKSQEAATLKQQVEELNKKLSGDESTILMKKIKTYENENASLAKSTEIYKGKLETMAKKMAQGKVKDDSKRLQDENKALGRSKSQLENKLAVEMRTKKAVEDRLEKTKETEKELHKRVAEFSAAKKKSDQELKSLQDVNSKLNTVVSQTGGESKINPKIVNELETRVSELTADLLAAKSAEKEAASDDSSSEMAEQLAARNGQLEAKLIEMAGKLKEAEFAKSRGSADNQSAKEKRLDQSVKKLGAELTKAKNEVSEKKKDLIKMKSENTAVQNKMKVMEKEMARLKGGAAKKGKKAA